MAILFSSNKIPALAEFSLQERQQILSIALSKLSVPEKFILNIIKLAMLIPPFLYLANLEVIKLITTLTFVLIAYFVLLRPVVLFFSQRHLKAAIKTFKSSD
jgi:hypothetical protein